MQDWYDIYKERMNERYARKIREKYAPFLAALRFPDTHHFLELGCGAGFITKELRSYFKYGTFTLLDSCPKMLSLAIENNPHRECRFMCADITRSHNIPYCDPHTVVHSHGVLEHFSDEEIIRIVSLADNYAPKQVHYVPGAKYETPSRGDERLMHPEQWYDILKSTRRNLDVEVSTFNDDHDILLTIYGSER